MTHLTGDFAQAVKLSSEVLAVPAGSIRRPPPTWFWKRRWPTAAKWPARRASAAARRASSASHCSRASAKPLPETLEAIAQADLITLGPGSLFTSVIPNLLVDGIPQAIAASPALKAYFVNLMSQPGETTQLPRLRPCRGAPAALRPRCAAT